VHKIPGIILLILIAAAGVLGLSAVGTQIGVYALDHKYPPQGWMIDVAGGQLHVMDVGPRNAAGPPIVMIHGASSSLGTMRVPLGDMLAKSHRVILIDRPGQGWSTREDLKKSSPAMQARMIDEALGKLGVAKAIVVVHSLAGVTYPWPGGVGTYNEVVTTPWIGPLLAYTITLPIGLILTEPATRTVFLPQIMPEGYVQQAAIPLILRPRSFLANAWDLTTLKAAVTEQAPRYGEITAPTVVIAGDADTTVSPEIHSRRFAATVPGARLIMLPNVGHMVQNAAPDLVLHEIDAMIAGADTKPKAAMR